MKFQLRDQTFVIRWQHIEEDVQIGAYLYKSNAVKHLDQRVQKHGTHGYGAVTLCEIRRVDPPQAVDERAIHVVLSEGHSICRVMDMWDPEVRAYRLDRHYGRKQALRHALENGSWSKEDRETIWALFNEEWPPQKHPRTTVTLSRENGLAKAFASKDRDRLLELVEAYLPHLLA